MTLTGVKSKTLKSINIKNTVKIGGKTFKITAIGKSAFKGCNKVTKAAIGNNVTTIGANAFENCTKQNNVTIGKSVKTIQTKAFNNCKSLKKITIKSTVLKSVGKQALKGMHKTANIIVPKKQLSVYKNLLENKGQSSTVVIKK